MDVMKCSGALSCCRELLLEGLGYRDDWVAGQLSCQPALQVGRNTTSGLQLAYSCLNIGLQLAYCCLTVGLPLAYCCHKNFPSAL